MPKPALAFLNIKINLTTISSLNADDLVLAKIVRQLRKICRADLSRGGRKYAAQLPLFFHSKDRSAFLAVDARAAMPNNTNDRGNTWKTSDRNLGRYLL